MHEKTCYIFASYNIDGDIILPNEDDYVIAADGGYRHVLRFQLVPDLIIGDMDSIDTIPDDIEICRLPSEKDDTDTLAAIKTGLKRGYKRFYIYGGIGGRLDHTLANLQSLVYLSKHHARGFLFDEKTVTTAITDGEMEFDEKHRGIVSVFSMDGTALGVNETGLKYTLRHSVIHSDFPIGVSNEFTGEKSVISVESGTLIIIHDLTK